jgi:hypothetical protein
MEPLAFNQSCRTHSFCHFKFMMRAHFKSNQGCNAMNDANEWPANKVRGLLSSIIPFVN